MVEMDLTDTRADDDSFDMILCSHVLEHIPDDRKAMAELHRILRTGGHLFIQVPIGDKPTYEDFSITSPQERERAFGQKDHVRIYGPDIVQRLADAGFRVQTVKASDLCSQAESQAIAAKGRSVLVCTKR